MSDTPAIANPNPTRPINYASAMDGFMSSLEEVHVAIDGVGLERPLQHLVQLRASQINRCAHCVKMHAREAREDRESSERVDRLIVWNQVRDFTPREQAALRWTEALTELDERTDFGSVRAELRQHFSEPEIGALTATIAMINLWNRIQIASR